MQQIYQKLEASQVWRLTESLWVLVQPDGKNGEGPESKLNSSRIRGLAFPLPALPELTFGSWVPGPAPAYPKTSTPEPKSLVWTKSR
jgi:hypothetical protein